MNKAELENKIDEIHCQIMTLREEADLIKDADEQLDGLYRKKARYGEYVKKAAFVEKLEEFYIVQTGNGLDIKSITYDYDGYDEKLKVTFETGVKYVWINFDGKEAILKDFVRFLNNFNDYAWEKE